MQLTTHGHCLFEGKTDKGLPILLRYPKRDDIQDLLDFINPISKEQTYIHFQGEIVTLKEETEWVEKRLQDIQYHKAVHLLAFSENKLIGGSDIFLKEFTAKHEGIFGIVIAKEYRGKGVGQCLMQHILEEGEKELSQLHLITLEVFGDNEVAKQMYQKFGFQEYGRLPKGVFRKEQYEDCIHMFKKIR